MVERKSLNCHVLSNTHWDREWRYPFQSYQMDLVDLLDRLLDILEYEPEYLSFYLDSQTLILQDYFQIRPENKERLIKLVKSGRLEIGPWYTLPDCWGAPGESLVRNLLYGHRDATELGGVVKCGYTPFSNGQISQMPQLYRGFGIDNIMFYRGIGKHIAPSDFIWQGVDGSRLFAFRFGDYARYNYYYLCYRDGLFGRTSSMRDYTWNPDEIPYHVAVDQAQDRQYGWLNQKLTVHQEMLRPSLDNAVKYTAPDAQTNQLMYMMGHDHSFAAREELDLIRALANEAGPNGERIFHSCFTDYMNAFRTEVDAGKLKVVTGEMRHTLKEGLWTTLMALILSCRLYLKQRNAQICRGILDGAEPLAAMAWITGSKYPSRFLELAWRHILVNHAHDAIGGCSVDKVHTAMMARWDEVETISDELIRRSMRDIAGRINGIKHFNRNDIQLTVFNTISKRTAIAEFIIDLPQQVVVTHASSNVPYPGETGSSDDQSLKTTRIRICDPNGNSLTTQVLSCEEYDPTIEGGYETTMQFFVDRYRVAVELKDLPSQGWRIYSVAPSSDKVIDGELLNQNGELENEYLIVSVNPDGTIKLTDKISGRTLDNLLYLEDTAEFGDPWNRKVPINDTPYITKNTVKARTTVVNKGPLLSKLKIEYEFPLPKGKDGLQRSSVFERVPVTLELTLRKDNRFLEAALLIDNRVENHRLRLMVPSGVTNATHSYADGQFDVLERPITISDCDDWKEKPYPTHPMWSFVGVSDRAKGFTVLQDGLTEYEVVDDFERTIAITLMRTFSTFVYGRPTPGSQMVGKHSYKFALVPHSGNWETANIPMLVSHWLTPVYALESAPTQGNLPFEHSMFELTGDNLQVSAIKQSENKDELVVRFYNSSSLESSAMIKLGFPIAKATVLTLEEMPEQDLPVHADESVTLSVPGKKIITISFKCK